MIEVRELHLPGARQTGAVTHFQDSLTSTLHSLTARHPLFCQTPQNSQILPVFVKALLVGTPWGLCYILTR